MKQALLLLILIVCLLSSSCVSVKGKIWKHYSGFSIGDFIEFNNDVYSIDEDGNIYKFKKKVAILIETRFGLVGNHQIVIESVDVIEYTNYKERGIYTIN